MEAMLARRTLVAAFALLANFSCALALGLDDYVEPSLCDGVEDCPAPSSSCSIAQCFESVCREEYLPQLSPCGDGAACDGAGRCLAATGLPCVSSDVCASGHCVDGVCCEAACNNCYSCGNERGECRPLALGVTDDDCPAPAICDGVGKCARGELLWGTTVGGVGNESVAHLAPAPEDALALVIPFAAPMTIGREQITFAGPINDSLQLVMSAEGALTSYAPLAAEPSDVAANAIAVASADRVVIGGGFVGAATIAGVPHVGTAQQSMFLVGANLSTHEEVWSTAYIDATVANGNGQVHDLEAIEGDVVAVGQFPGQVDFGTGAIASLGMLDAAMWRVDADSGALRWVVTYGGASHDVLRAVVASSDGLYAVGSSSGPATYGGTLLDIANDDRWVPVIVHTDAASGHQWSRWFPCTGDACHFTDVAVGEGAVYVGGYFDGTLTLDAFVLTAGMPSDGFFARLDPATGTVMWAYALGGNQTQVTGIGVDALGHVVLATHARGMPTYNGSPVAIVGVSYVVLASFTPEGALLWTRNLGVSGSTQYSGRLAILPDGIAFVGQFDLAVALADPVMSTAALDAFVALFAP
jgi:outer membrane protein assembly factor BamB